MAGTVAVRTGQVEIDSILAQRGDHLAPDPEASLQLAQESSHRLHFCLALHADDGPGALASLQQEVSWQSRGLRWLACHPLLYSAPEREPQESEGHTSPVHLITASACCKPEVAAAVEKMLVQVLRERLCVPVECYLTCPGPVPLFSGTMETLTMQPPAAARCLQEHGLAILQGALRGRALEVWRRHVDQQVAWAQQLLARRAVDVHDNNIFTFKEIAARGRHRFDLRLDVGPHWQSAKPCLQQVLQAAPWVPVVHAALGEDVISIVSVVYSTPGADAQDWHADGPPSADQRETYGVCVFVPLLDLNGVTGCTQFWPGSHVHEHLLGFGPAATVLESTVNGKVSVGDAILYDYRVLHRGLENLCSHGRRDVLQVVYHKSGYTEERNYSAESLIDS